MTLNGIKDKINKIVNEILLNRKHSELWTNIQSSMKNRIDLMNNRIKEMNSMDVYDFLNK